ncbi:2-phospho-L-lactate guanylyltransferase [Rubripirellula lacrimiformis]|uniref:2-phospho-L-lactate guanylyltransferase n=1 Tax=Rubripirellula lacrimiformis TaxID=1930273 RepID=A0A517N6B0_9BACT|nr:TIGR04282 family arsenosugar biosynthesis glycosyltransferase [Rubripirellula lacrimiformis]QDT02675.1 2-phospho-L-lactate guanylyltransferase [Rubripirellula lacrimiformis]
MSNDADCSDTAAIPLGNQRLGLMMKYWHPGKVKTRLGATIGYEQAANLHRFFVRQLCDALPKCGSARSLVLADRSDADALQQAIQAWQVGNQWDVEFQCPGDLGNRMEAWFRTHLTADSTDPSTAATDHPHSAILIGADCPLLNQSSIDAAWRTLEHADVVLGPAVDGGYYLIGIRGSSETLPAIHTWFSDVPWSTDRVLPITLQRIRQSGHKVVLLEPREDIDTIDELTRLCQQLRSQQSHADASTDLLLKSIESVLPTGSPPGHPS